METEQETYSACPSVRPKPRRSISKRLRFSIFSRDGFACRYCGAKSDSVQLVVDHVTPVCQGGGNEPENLITACQPCNAGKSGQTPTQAAPTERDRLRLSQELREQEEAFEKMQTAAKRREQLRQEVCNYYCEARGVESIMKPQLSTLTNLVDLHGVEPVLGWIDIAVSNLNPKTRDVDFVRYVCGIRRNWVKQHELETF
jgi:hypothetical protein